ncbi:SDR family oxidoreductase [Nocardia sp. NPDC050713]|uniref:SDR family NAD(P)-dependent oxidoreductase n=1 Tax=Nocardia sp. NPDC050713 TaxID=3154511 RepID=UPI0033C501D4
MAVTAPNRKTARMSDLSNAVVVVTGGATGIGLALAREAVNRGAKVMIADIDDATAAVDELREVGGDAASVVADISNIEDVRRLANATVERFGEVNVVCNNAVFAVPGTLQETAPELAGRMVRVNVEGAINIVHVFAPFLRDAATAGRPSYLLNTGSEHSLGVPPHVEPFSVYTTTKFATLGLTLTAHRDLADWGVGVSMLAPGWTLTEKVQAAVDADPAVAQAILPFAQESSIVAAKAYDGLLGGTRVIATNPFSRAFAMEHARALMIDVQELPLVEAPGEHAHDGSGDVGACPFMGAR